MLITMADDALDVVDNESENRLSASPPLKPTAKRHYQQTDVDYDPSKKVLWTVMKPMSIPCCNQNMVEEFHDIFQQLQGNGGEFLHHGEWHPVQYSVVASRHPTVFNLGGDLSLLMTLIRNRDRTALAYYSRLCVNTLYARIRCFDANIITISLVQGDAMGGGFEFALSSDVIIAEQGIRMGLPEVMFNLFPGMGAYSLLVRRVGMKLTEEIMMSGNIYQSDELHRLGIIDILVPRGEGEKAVDDFIRKRGRRFNAISSIYQCRRHINPVTYDELMNIANLWVDAVLRMDDADTHIISHLLRSQRSEQEKHRKAGTGFRPRFLDREPEPEKSALMSDI